MTFDNFCKKQRSTLILHYLLSSWFPGKCKLEPPYLPSVLEDDELEDFKRRLSEFMPSDSIILDLWNWDIHFELELCTDWFLSAAFGDADTLDSCSSDLTDFFLDKVDEYGMDYDQYQGEEEGSADFIKEESAKFIEKWRHNIATLNDKALRRSMEDPPWWWKSKEQINDP